MLHQLPWLPVLQYGMSPEVHVQKHETVAKVNRLALALRPNGNSWCIQYC